STIWVIVFLGNSCQEILKTVTDSLEVVQRAAPIEETVQGDSVDAVGAVLTIAAAVVLSLEIVKRETRAVTERREVKEVLPAKVVMRAVNVLGLAVNVLGLAVNNAETT